MLIIIGIYIFVTLLLGSFYYTLSVYNTFIKDTKTSKIKTEKKIEIKNLKPNINYNLSNLGNINFFNLPFRIKEQVTSKIENYNKPYLIAQNTEINYQGKEYQAVKIDSNLINKTFNYELTLINFLGHTNVTAVYSEDGTNFYPTKPISITNKEVKIKADHFTIFAIVETPVPQPTTGSGVFINEICFNCTTEWVELYNSNNTGINLNGWILKLAKTGNSQNININTNLIIPAKGYLVFEQGIAWPSGNRLADNGDTVILLNPSNAIVDQISYDDKSSSTIVGEVNLGTFNLNETIARKTDGNSVIKKRIVAKTTKNATNNIDDTIPPVITIDYLQTTDTTPKLTGTIDDYTATIKIKVNSTEYNATNNGDGTWSLSDNTITPALVDGFYDIIATAKDSSNNTGTDTTTDELLIDTTGPTIEITTPIAQDIFECQSSLEVTGTVIDSLSDVIEIKVQLLDADDNLIDENLITEINTDGSFTTNFDISSLVDGVYQIMVFTKDELNNTSQLEDAISIQIINTNCSSSSSSSSSNSDNSSSSSSSSSDSSSSTSSSTSSSSSSSSSSLSSSSSSSSSSITSQSSSSSSNGQISTSSSSQTQISRSFQNQFIEQIFTFASDTEESSSSSTSSSSSSSSPILSSNSQSSNTSFSSYSSKNNNSSPLSSSLSQTSKDTTQCNTNDNFPYWLIWVIILIIVLSLILPIISYTLIIKIIIIVANLINLLLSLNTYINIRNEQCDFNNWWWLVLILSIIQFVQLLSVILIKFSNQNDSEEK